MRPRPDIRIPDSLSMPDMEEQTLANGARLFVLRADAYEVARVSFVFRAGSLLQEHPFVAGATANLLAEGSTRMTGRAISEQLDFYGSYFEVNLDRDFVYVSFCSLTRYFDRTLEVAGEILLRPAFPETEVETYRRKRQQLLAVERQKVDVLAREAFAGAMFGDRHPYGIAYPESAYDGLTREQLVAHYDRCYRGGNCIVVCSGRIGAAERAAVAALAGSLPAGTVPQPELPERQADAFRRIVRADAVQSSIRTGRLLFPKPHPDFTGMQVVATLLGGYFGSRLMQNLRERHGYTYGVTAVTVNFDRAGYLAIGTQVGAGVTDAALAEIRREVARLRTEPVPDDELTLVKRFMTGEMMRILDGPFGIADVAIENILSGEAPEAVARTLNEIRATTPERIRQLALRYLDEADFVTVVAGPQPAGSEL